jgi:hypothetical protein
MGLCFTVLFHWNETRNLERLKKFKGKDIPLTGLGGP